MYLQLYLFKKSANKSLWENPCCLMRIVSNTPVYLNCLITLPASKRRGTLASFGFIHRTNCGDPLTIFCSKSINEYLKYVATVCCALDCEAKPLLQYRS